MAASMRNPVVVILGGTGTGKTKLSLEVAKLCSGEIISADAMQLYKGLDIITNKATAEERQSCKHHMIDFLSPLKENSTVVQYRDQAVSIIDSLLSQKKTPIIVGGTNYYIESLLWKHLVNKEDVKRASSVIQSTKAKFPKLQGISTTVQKNSTPSETELRTEKGLPRNDAETGTVSNNEEQTDSSSNDSELSSSEEDGVSVDIHPGMRINREKYEAMSSAELYQRLKDVDPEGAVKLHPNDRRKILRAVEVFDQHGVPLSKVHKAQHGAHHGLSGPLRYSDTCIFWLQCQQEVLDKRLDDRVDKMLEMGLVEELTDFHKQYNEHRLQAGKEADYTTGIFQSIGFKEFHEYLMLDEKDRETEEGKKTLEKCIEYLKIATRRYARYQNRWIKRRFLKRPGKDTVPPLYGLDATDVAKWEQNVSIPAASILSALRKGEESPIAPLPYEGEYMAQFEQNECKHCKVTTVTAERWQEHLTSKRHKKTMQHYRKQISRLNKTLDEYVQEKKRNDEKDEQSLKT